MRAALLSLAVALALAATATAAPAFPVIGKPAPDFTLTDQTGARVRLSQFRGRIVLLNFIYTHCVDVCPLTTAALARVQRQLIARGWWVREVAFLSVTTDPARDTPSQLSRYAKVYKADPAGWRFLTGAMPEVAAVWRAYGVVVRPAANGLQEHALPVFVIDRGGTVLGAYPPNPRPDDVLSDIGTLR